MSDSKPPSKEYTNGEVTVVWKPRTCIHAAECVKGLPSVFDAKSKPWINIQGANTEEIIKQVDMCPSGALSYYRNDGSANAEVQDSSLENAQVIEALKNGPLMVVGDVMVKGSDGTETMKKAKAFLCRCGASNNKPFCDGEHKKIGFEA